MLRSQKGFPKARCEQATGSHCVGFIEKTRVASGANCNQRQKHFPNTGTNTTTTITVRNMQLTQRTQGCGDDAFPEPTKGLVIFVLDAATLQFTRHCPYQSLKFKVLRGVIHCLNTNQTSRCFRLSSIESIFPLRFAELFS